MMTNSPPRRPRLTFVLLSSAACATSFVTNAHASPVDPGGVVEEFDTTLAARPDLAGTALVSNDFSMSFDSFALSVHSEVVQDPATHQLTFLYRLQSPSRLIGVEDVAIGGFDNLSTAVVNLLDSAGETAAPLA